MFSSGKVGIIEGSNGLELNTGAANIFFGKKLLARPVVHSSVK